MHTSQALMQVFHRYFPPFVWPSQTCIKVAFLWTTWNFMIQNIYAASPFQKATEGIRSHKHVFEVCACIMVLDYSWHEHPLNSQCFQKSEFIIFSNQNIDSCAQFKNVFCSRSHHQLVVERIRNSKQQWTWLCRF